MLSIYSSRHFTDPNKFISNWRCDYGSNGQMVISEKHSALHHMAQNVTEIITAVVHLRIPTDERDVFFLSLFLSFSFFFFASTPFKKFGSDCLISTTALSHRLRFEISRKDCWIFLHSLLLCANNSYYSIAPLKVVCRITRSTNFSKVRSEADGILNLTLQQYNN